MEPLTETQKSNATQIRNMFTKQKKLIGHYYKAADLQQPVVWLMRETGKVDVFENATAGTFTYTHSSGKERFIILVPALKITFAYLDREVRGYICHENHPLPLPADPVVTSEEMGILLEKTLNDIKKWRAAEQTAIGKKWVQIAIAAGIIIMAYMVYKIVVGDPTPPQQIVYLTPDQLTP